jgi:hypothetical protein
MDIPWYGCKGHLRKEANIRNAVFFEPERRFFAPVFFLAKKVQPQTGLRHWGACVPRWENLPQPRWGVRWRSQYQCGWKSHTPN